VLSGELGIYLVAALAMARIQSDGLVEVAPAGGRIQAGLTAVAQVADLLADGRFNGGRREGRRTLDAPAGITTFKKVKSEVLGV
jgi:hypothetical protein